MLVREVCKFWNAKFKILRLSQMQSFACSLWSSKFCQFVAFVKTKMVASFPPLAASLKHVCEGFILGKMQCFEFPKDGFVHATCKLELVYSDVCGPMQTLSFGNHSYFVTFIDDYLRFHWVYPLKAKSRVFT